MNYLQQAARYPKLASPHYPLSACGEGKDEVQGEANAAASCWKLDPKRSKAVLLSSPIIKGAPCHTAEYSVP
jgi:hypothetical protein